MVRLWVLLYLLPSWNKASSTAVLSSTVIDTTVTGTSAPRGKTPGTRTSCQSEWILQISTESKYLPRTNSLLFHLLSMSFPVKMQTFCCNSLFHHLMIYLIKSQKSIQNSPSSARWAQSSLFRCGGQFGQSSAQGPVQENRPHGFLSCSNLRTGNRR